MFYLIGVNPCSTANCRQGQGCVINQYGVATCQCIPWCPPIIKPVCGTDHKTYNTKCHLLQHACEMRKNTKLAYYSRCGKYCF